jgi:hypothetical protein
MAAAAHTWLRVRVDTQPHRKLHKKLRYMVHRWSRHPLVDGQGPCVEDTLPSRASANQYKKTHQHVCRQVQPLQSNFSISGSIASGLVTGA